MLVVEDQGRIVGGAFAFNSTLKAIGLDPGYLGKGFGHALIKRIEEEAARLGRGGISLGIGTEPGDARGFYAQMGYSGRSRTGKQLPVSPIISYGQPA